jgi:hypothetical protein
MPDDTDTTQSGDASDADAGPDYGASADDGSTDDQGDAGWDGSPDSGEGSGDSGDGADTYGTADYGTAEFANGMGTGASGDTDIQGVWHDGETLTLGEKWQSLKAAGGGWLTDVYDTTAGFIDMVAGDDPAADRHLNAAAAEGMAYKRYLREAFQGKRITSSAEEDWYRQHGQDES